MAEAIHRTTLEHATPCALCAARGADALGALGAPVIGPPFETCWRCGALVERPGRNEWDILARPLRRAAVAARARVALLAGLVPLGVLLALVAAGSRPWRAREAWICLAAGWLLAGAFEGLRLSAEIRASRRRMADPMYRAKLVAHGIASARS